VSQHVIDVAHDQPLDALIVIDQQVPGKRVHGEGDHEHDARHGVARIRRQQGTVLLIPVQVHVGQAPSLREPLLLAGAQVHAHHGAQSPAPLTDRCLARRAHAWLRHVSHDVLSDLRRGLEPLAPSREVIVVEQPLCPLVRWRHASGNVVTRMNLDSPVDERVGVVVADIHVQPVPRCYKA